MTAFPWSLSEIALQVKTGELKPTGIVETAFDQIHKKEQEIQAWCYLAPDLALEQAAALTSEIRNSGPRSPLHGVPYAVKDIFDTAGVPTEWGSKILKGRIPDTDCSIVKKLNSLGAVMMGKTHTTAFAYYDTGPTRNPRNSQHTPGGSSSGSAAAVAAGMVPFAIGTQTQGSVLRPASFCGTVGFKPTYNRLPLAGVMAFAPSLDHAGFFTPSVNDMQFLWEALGFETSTQSTQVLYVVNWPPGCELDNVMKLAIEDAASRLSKSGFEVKHVSRPSFFDELSPAQWIIMAYEASQEHGKQLKTHGSDLGEQLALVLEQGQQITKDSYEFALNILQDAWGEYSRWSEEHPIVMTPAALGPAPAGLVSSGDPSCNALFTALRAPAISIPMPSISGQLPLGLQLTASQGADDLLLATAEAVELILNK